MAHNDDRVPFPERANYGCVNCGSINHTTGDRAWCPVEKDRQSRELTAAIEAESASSTAQGQE